MNKCEYLIGIGAAKAGTTLLYDLLSGHPELRKGKEKELHYFDRTDEPTKSAYDALFSGCGVGFDVTPIYIYYKECHKKIASTLGKDSVKLVALLRDPIKRARSHYNMCVFQGKETLDFDECFYSEEERMALSERDRRFHSYFSRGLYSKQLDSLYETFPKENVLVLLYEDFVANQQRYIDEICDFAGINRIEIKERYSNRGLYRMRFKWLDGIARKLSLCVPKRFRFKPLRDIKHFIADRLGRPPREEPLDKDFLGVLKGYYANDVERLNSVYRIDTSKWKSLC